MELVKYNNNSISSVTALGSLSSGSMVLLATNTITSGVSSSSFTSNIDSTYDTYMFKFINMHPASDGVQFQFNGSIDGGSNYNVTKTTSYFRAGTDEGDTGASVDYRASEDLAQSTGGQIILQQMGNDNDQCGSGTLHLFNPSSTTFVKHFISRVDGMAHNDQLLSDFIAGYFNTTSAINAIQFSIEAGTIESGDICLYGIL